MNLKFHKNFVACFIVLIVTACFIPAIAWAFPPGDGMPEGLAAKCHQRSMLGIWRNPQMVEEFKLTKEQVKQLRDADFKFRAEQLELRSQLDNLYLQMDKAVSDDNIDSAAVLQLAKKISDIRGKIFVQSIELYLAIEKHMNADQIRKLKLNDMFPKMRGPMPAGEAPPRASFD